MVPAYVMGKDKIPSFFSQINISQRSTVLNKDWLHSWCQLQKFHKTDCALSIIIIRHSIQTPPTNGAIDLL